MAVEAVFTYGPPLRGRNVRLIEIRPGSESGENPLEIDLAERSLDTAKFEALSYVWGEKATRQRIRCNGRWMHIGSNLLDALRERARRRLFGPVWADAICINQSDDREKTAQVRMMRDIYARAQRVVIWLGREQAGDREGYELAKSLYQKLDGANYNMDATTYDFDDFGPISEGVSGPRIDNPGWADLFDILGHPWFTRIWVIQELLVAQKSIMWRGALDINTHIILWSAMQVARHRDLYEKFDLFMGSPPSSALMARNIATGYLRYKGAGPIPIYDTISWYNGMEATDRRDRYFALAGISAGLDAGFVDYKRSYRDIACLVGKMALLGFPIYRISPGGAEELAFTGSCEAHRFLIEWLAFHANPQNHALGLPSWVPDLTSPHSSGLLMSGFYNTLYMQGCREISLPEVRLRQGTRLIWSGASPPPRFIPVPDAIDIMGAVFDRIKTLARERPPLPRLDARDQRKIIQSSQDVNPLRAFEAVSQYETEMIYWLSEIRTLADPILQGSDSIMSGSQGSFDAFWRTLIYNREPSFNYKYPNQKPASWLGISFGYWYLWKKLMMKRLWQQNVVQHVVFSEVLKTLANPFDKAEGRVRGGRRFFVSANGRFGWVPLRTNVDDQVCVLRGMRIPVIMRPQGNRWEFIGACYVHGSMDGEIWDLGGLQWGFMSFV
ncbi:heterokaryon incompatibility protein-domain-containing protein [Xylariaceae sp. FL0662B]|nr:heterokaryon incompatibility protein-domain-containing protein [Xylariaceae sp. FL0662B]